MTWTSLLQIFQYAFCVCVCEREHERARESERVCLRLHCLGGPGQGHVIFTLTSHCSMYILLYSMYVHTRTYVYIYIYIHVHLYLHIHTYTFIHWYIHTFTQIHISTVGIHGTPIFSPNPPPLPPPPYIHLKNGIPNAILG